MLKKINNLTFIILFLIVIAVPFVFTNWTSGGVSEDENRVLAKFPEFVVDGKWNEKFTTEFETWFMDHLGFRTELINANTTLQYRCFDRMLSKSNYLIGRNGDINYATEEMLKDYAHVNLRSEQAVAEIGQSYQAISDWMEQRDISFYYVQCFDKHSIYPEQFVDTVKQIGDVSKTDQIIEYLNNKTTVKTISMKPVLLEAKKNYEVFSNWGDPTHWSPRGAYVGYRHLMERLNKDHSDIFPVLEESDYNITVKNDGITINQVIHQEDMIEQFSIIDSKAQKGDVSVMGKWVDEQWHSVWKNPNAKNDVKLLIMGDSYFNNYIIDDIAESFSEVWFIWANYTEDLTEIVESYDPDMVIYECAERVDRSAAVCNLAKSLNN